MYLFIGLNLNNHSVDPGSLHVVFLLYIVHNWVATMRSTTQPFSTNFAIHLEDCEHWYLSGGCAQNKEVYSVLSICNYFNAARVSTNNCFMSCKHKALKSSAPKGQFCGSASNTNSDSEERGSERWPCNESPELHSSCHKCCIWWSPTAWEAFPYGLKYFYLREHAPNTVRHMHTENCVLHALHNLLCMPPPHLLFKSLDPPLCIELGWVSL